MRKTFLFFSALLFAVFVSAETQTTVYYAVPDRVVGSYTVKLNAKLQGDKPDDQAQWTQVNFSKTDKTYHSNPIYEATFTAIYDGVSTLQFQLYDGDEWKSQEVIYADGWHNVSSFNGKLREYDQSKWMVYTCDDCPVPEPELACYGIKKEDGTFIAGVQNLDYQGIGSEYMLLGISFTQGERWQLCDSCNDYATWVVNLDASSTMCVTKDDSWYTSVEVGSYDIYIKIIGEGQDQVYVGCATCSKHGAVPSQCPDVLLQGFYYDSYEVDSAHAGTELYGDTKWKTLLAQSGEIGAYFDLIWLPPSSYASGTGYHPKQYSNQNSDWGSRTDLTKLIKAFHNVGTKVVADIVINHTEAMASWCDFAVQNFGEYGTFQPDGSYICGNDEMNWDTPDIKKKAGECWGTASGIDDDGANWEAARDWSHSEVKVQEMFKAYLKWMRNEIGYDGFRYDKGDGFHNWHMDNYNKASEPYIAFMEYYSSNSAIKSGIANANNNVMAFDFQTRWRTFRDGFAAGNYTNCRQSGISDWGENDIGLIASNMSKYAITFIENHDMFMRDDNDNEFCGRGNSMKPENKGKLMRANAYLLSMPGVPCVFYPHWAKYKEDLKPMIDARHLAGVHSESELTDEEVSATGYKVSVHGTNGFLILTMGDKTITEATGTNDWLNTYNYTKVASGEGYAIWVTHTNDVAPGLMVTPSADFQNAEQGIKVGMKAVGGSGSATIYYTLDNTDPTTESAVYSDTLTFKETTTLKVMAACGEAQTAVQTYTYTYREPLKHGITVYFNKPAEWEKVYFYAWLPGKDEQGNPTAENIMGAYPGQRIYQDAKGWYSYEFDQSMDSVNFCISSGEDCGALNVRSNDLVADYDVYYAWEEGHEAESKYEKELEEEIPLNPEFDLVISPESGNFRDMTEGQRVQLTVVGHEGASIYYTTDGSDPSTCANPAMDTVSFVVKQTTTVRAYAAYTPDPSTVIKTNEYANTYTYKAPQSGPITVKFIQPKDMVDPATGDTISHAWKDLYLYAFTRVKVGSKFKDTPYSLDGKSPKWPGMKWTTTETDAKGVQWHTWTMKDDIKEIYVIFTEGDKKPQTQDIYLTENMCYIWNPSCRRAVEDPDCDGVADGLEEIFANPALLQSAFRKIIVNDHLYILHDNRMYNIFGCPLR